MRVVEVESPDSQGSGVRARRSAAPRVELHCRGCAYGVVVRVAPPVCPMCGGTEWEYGAWRPFSRRPPDRAA